jgi:hypothetical protein
MKVERLKADLELRLGRCLTKEECDTILLVVLSTTGGRKKQAKAAQRAVLTLAAKNSN